MENLNDLIEIAETTAKNAGKILLEGGQDLRSIEFEDKRDVKLEADRKSEEYIRSVLGEHSGFPVVGEELGGDSSLVDKDIPYWVVDPLDGTFNYLRGSPQCAVSIGLLVGEEPLLGVIYDFNRDELFRGVENSGLYINGQEVKPEWATDLEQAALATGFPAGMDQSPERMEAFVNRIGPYKKVRMIGSAALAMAYVASAKFDAYYEETSRLWDVAAGMALIKAAGGVLKIEKSKSGKALAYDVWAAGRESFILAD